MPVVDASVVVDWVAPRVDPHGPAVRLLALLVRADAELAAPGLLVVEVAEALADGVRAGRWTGAEAEEAYALLRRLPVRLVDEPGDLDRAWQLARHADGHPVRELVYVALAERLGERLLTADRGLRRHVRRLDLLRALDPPQVAPVSADGTDRSARSGRSRR